MVKIKELVKRFSSNSAYSEWDRTVAQEWLAATRCGELDAELLSVTRDQLDENACEERNKIKKDTICFLRRYFDERPVVAHALDSLFAAFGVDDEAERRQEFFPFDRLYSREEIAVLLLKHLQPVPGRTRNTREDIAEYFMTSSRTINTYISEMLPARDDAQSAKVLGQIVQMDPARRTNAPESTTHPLFLPLSMVELYALVDMLQKHTGNEIEGRIAQRILERVREQVTEYAKERLGRIEGFSRTSASMHYPDNQYDLGRELLISEKEGVFAEVEYEEKGEVLHCAGRISRCSESEAAIKVVNGRDVFRIPYRRIISLRNSQE